mmetsp:Transcript_62324/g.115674  ORF Transcript_62324/g.115674 Transcript_62324/m.115674 type:complete len:233 (+) Transcript_62324:61-759(+)
MDPESGVASPTSDRNALIGGVGDSLVQRVLRAVVSRLRGVFGSLLTKERAVGVENRYYYDEAEKVWKMRGETEQDRAEAEVYRFHTSRGLSSSAAPHTTACDPTRGGYVEPPPPPPSGGPVTTSLRGGDPNDAAAAAASLIHPVYAPHGLGGPQATAAHQNFGAPPVGRPPNQAPARTSPFASPAQTPLTSPFGPGTVAPMAPPSPLANPFGASPLAAPFQGQGQLAANNSA